MYIFFLRFGLLGHRFRFQFVKHYIICGLIKQRECAIVFKHVTIEIDEIEIQINSRLARHIPYGPCAVSVHSFQALVF